MMNEANMMLASQFTQTGLLLLDVGEGGGAAAHVGEEQGRGHHYSLTDQVFFFTTVNLEGENSALPL